MKDNKDNTNEGLYSKLNVSHAKEDVHKAIKNIDKGIFPNAFCKILPDISGDPQYCSIFHSDSAGTKTSLAYMMYKENGKLDYFRGVVQDAIVMNVDDVLCVGVRGNVLISDTIGRNKNLISGEIISTIIDEHIKFTQKLTELGFTINLAGGETEDIGDLMRTLEIGVSLFARTPRSQIITGDNIKPNDVIIGLSSFGKASYEEQYNSGIGSNGLTLARHGSLSHQYYAKYPECYDPKLDEKVVFFGKHNLNDPLPETPLTIGEALLSPTRTYAPIIIEILEKYHNKVHFICHNSGGGLTKILNFGRKLKYIKNNLFNIPPLFKMIQESSGASWREMYQVFNMGHRMEIITEQEYTEDMISLSKKYGVDAKKIGYIEQNNEQDSNNKVLIQSEKGTFEYKL